jgi:hypothetical protein
MSLLLSADEPVRHPGARRWVPIQPAARLHPVAAEQRGDPPGCRTVGGRGAGHGVTAVRGLGW